jgi:hypothetical protein
MSHPCFRAVDSRDRITAKTSAPATDRKPPEIFWRNFIVRPSHSARLLDSATRMDKHRIHPHDHTAYRKAFMPLTHF